MSTFEGTLRLPNLAAGIKLGKRGIARVTADELVVSAKQNAMDQLLLPIDPRKSSWSKSNLPSCSVVIDGLG
jgi:bifunctional ADP-heptose synthase (sugar kinase/adenylyltransferase)